MSSLRAFAIVWGFVLIALSMLHAEGGFKYSYVPKKVYENQLFPVTIIDTRIEKKTPHYRFESIDGVKPISTTPLVIKNGDDNFYTFYFKAHREGEITLPRLYIEADEKVTLLPSYSVPVHRLPPQEDFCGVLAADMKIRNSQVSHFDEQNYLVTLSIEAYESNLEDMHLDGVVESGIEDVKRKGAKSEGEFYVVIPRTQILLKFSYFNTIKQQFVTLETTVELIENSVVTQSDLNPKEDSFDTLKKYTVIALVGFFFLMFLIYRDFFYLILGTVSFITLLTFYTPKAQVCIKQGAPLYILPTETASISTKVAERYTTPLLGERLNFRKVAYKNGIIGWVKDEDICKN